MNALCAHCAHCAHCDHFVDHWPPVLHLPMASDIHLSLPRRARTLVVLRQVQGRLIDASK